jgi:ABC-type Fe3+ transport system permease subunit
MKILILVVVLILVAPTIVKRFDSEEEKEQQSGGLLVRIVRRHGLRRTFLLALGFVVAVGVVAVVLVKR